MANVLFITEQYLKDFSIINDNTDMKILTPTIDMVQDMYIHPIVGTGIFNELKTQIVAGTVTALNATLLQDYIQKAMLWYILAEAPPIFVYRFANKGVMKKSSENSQPADLDDINFLIDRFTNKAEWYAERITKYLLENESSYPLYSNPGSGVDTIIPKKTNYSTGMYLGDTPKRKGSFEERFQGNIDSDCW